MITYQKRPHSQRFYLNSGYKMTQPHIFICDDIIHPNYSKKKKQKIKSSNERHIFLSVYLCMESGNLCRNDTHI